MSEDKGNPKKFRSAAKDDSFVPRRTFVPGDVKSVKVELDEKGEIVSTNQDRHGNQIYVDKFGIRRNYANEDREAGIVPNLDYQDQYELERSVDQDGDLKGYIDIGQQRVLENIVKNTVAISSGNNIGGYLDNPYDNKVLQSEGDYEAEGTKESVDQELLLKVAKMLQNAPNEIIKREVNIKKGMALHCENCGCTDITIKSNFCPNCGSRFE
jgi:rubrerythrin